MFAPFLLALVALGSAGPPATLGPVPAIQDEDPQKVFRERWEAAGDDTEALWELYLWADAYGLEKEGKRCLRRIVDLDPAHRKAHEALGHIFHDGKWFTSERKLEEYKKEEAERRAREQGLVDYEGEWVPAEDVPFLEKGLVRDESGAWVSKEEHEKLQAGWKRQDLVWIPPDEIENIEKGLWKCGDQWLSLEEADRFHALIGRWWSIPTDHFTLHSTCSRELSLRAVDLLYLAYRDLVRVVGVHPPEPVEVVLLNSEQQYRTLSSGDSPLGNIETTGLSSVHHAFFADAWFDLPAEVFHGAGVGYWDASSDAGNSWGPLSLRHAAAHSYLEAVDPSTKTVEKTFSSRGRDFDPEDFWGEKRFPRWFRYGVAAYVERYYVDSTVAQGGNPNWTREWSVQNIVNKGGLRPVQQIFDAQLDAANPDDGAKLINERGLVVAFLVDGKVPALAEAHGELKAKIKSGEDLKPVFRKIERLVVEHEQELRKFANL